MKALDIARRNRVREVQSRFKSEILAQPILDCWEEGDSKVTAWVVFAIGAGLTADEARAAMHWERFDPLVMDNIPQAGGVQARR